MSALNNNTKKGNLQDINEALHFLDLDRSNITLPPQLANATSVLIHNQGQYINTFQFRDQGVASVSQCIVQLETKGWL